jgi:hypothetical protein
MSAFERIKYSFYVLISVTTILVLTLSILEGFGISGGDTDFAVHPLYVLSVLSIGFAIAPALSKRVPVAGDIPTEEGGAKPLLGYSLRVVALVAICAVLAALAYLVVFLLERFT